MRYYFKKDNLLYISLIFILLLAGFYFRIKGLGKWPLALDEYYILKSAGNILKYGLPEWTSGGYYTRGLLYQYLIAGLLTLGVKAEFAGRIIPVVLNIVSVPALFILAKKISGRFFALIVVIAFIFSVWEIEFSRFARMYVPFQTLFIWYLFFLYKYCIENHNPSLKWVFILSFGSIFLFEASIFLILLNFVILFGDEEKRFKPQNIFRDKKKLIIAGLSIIIFLAAYYFSRWDTRSIGSGLNFPPGYLETHSDLLQGSLFYKPLILLTTFSQNIAWVIPFISVLLLSLFSVYKLFKSRERDIFNKFFLTILIILALLNFFGLVILISLIYLTLNWLSLSDIKKKEILWVFSAISAYFIFWVIYAYFTNTWYVFFEDFEGGGSALALAKKMALLLFNYPNLYFDFYRFALTVPVQSGVFIISVFVVVISTSAKEYRDSINTRFVIFILLLLLLIFSSINTTLGETRYTFFLYPLVLILFLLFFKTVTEFLLKDSRREKIAFAIIAAVFFIFSGDFNLKHIINIDSKEYNFRIVYGKNMVRHYYPRWDVKTPAEVVNKEALENDIIIIDELNIEYYLDRLDYIYIHYDHERFVILSTNKGRTERWTNASLVYTNHQLLDLIKNTKGFLWFITIHKPHLDEINFKENFKEFLYYTSLDKDIFLYRIPGGTTIQ